MKIPRRTRAPMALIATLATALAVGAAGCGSSASGGSGGSGGSGAPAQSLVVAIPPVISGADVYVAQSQGYFAQHHLNVTVKTLNGGSAIVPAMEGGSVQVGESNVLSIIQGAARGIREPCFSGANTDPPSGHYLSLVASGKAGVTSAAGLAGKTVAVNATSGVNQLLTDAYLASHGVDPGSVSFISLQFPDMPAALSAGRVAAAMTSEPFTTISLGQGGHLLTGTPLSFVPGRPTYSCWNASSSWLASHKTEAAGFAAAMSQADAYIGAHPARFRSIASAHLSISSHVLRTMTLPVFTSSLAAGDMTAWEHAAAKYHLLTSTPPMTSVLEDVRP
jgi:NitT/TauT family transport system substrate-binding protein